MTISQIEVRDCERCGVRQEMRHNDDKYDWAKIYAAQENAALMRIGSPGHYADLCPQCTKSLADWWAAATRPSAPDYCDMHAAN